MYVILLKISLNQSAILLYIHTRSLDDSLSNFFCQQEGREDCYEARLHVRQTDHQDARNYYLTVENERGLDRHAVHLAVRGSYTGKFRSSPLITLLTLNR